MRALIYSPFRVLLRTNRRIQFIDDPRVLGVLDSLERIDLHKRTLSQSNRGGRGLEDADVELTGIERDFISNYFVFERRGTDRVKAVAEL